VTDFKILQICFQIFSTIGHILPVSQGTTLHREEGSGHAAIIRLFPQQKLDVTNQIHAVCRSHPLSWSTLTSQHV